ncbi:hypothetical protein LSH36_97g07083 [Paralvinella palmiformis]|uniref:Glycosyl transferase family 3 N-terminal domain-containing protein n=1 Tax=Paralvinella palmiformis TaxID=53620 RepID=A0AAD9K0I6_9ANNE|nr:hypothetical protein LSH36_97g07083 [Paralvinella palmiformis]
MAATARKEGQTARSSVHSGLISYNIRDILKSKRDGKELHWEELEYFVKGLMKGTIKDAQIVSARNRGHKRPPPGT